jgi:2-polyprenyl-3-methyl-5-hydroxy-6-metoxy-1,4-benzoquinol methylase
MRKFDPSVREWMDVDQPISPELERDLDNLATLNRRFGSHALVLDFLRSRLDAPQGSAPSTTQPWRILDLATGSGDIPRAIAEWAARNGIEISVDAVDAQRSTLEIARKRSSAFPNLHFHEGDIRTFGESHTRDADPAIDDPDPAGWDIVLCSLALHHFSEEDAVRVLRHAASLASRHVLVSDLRRCALGTFGVDLLTAVWMREPMTRNDARVSVRRAFSFDELAALARAAGWHDFQHARAFCFRQTISLDMSSS